MFADSIFHNLVSDEPSYSQLLFNLMRRDNDFRLFVLARLLRLTPREIPPVPCDALHREGWPSGDGRPNWGRPDIVIEKKGALHVCLELKTRTNCRLTRYQEIPPPNHSELKGYLGTLLRKQGKRWLVFLVPKYWDHLEDTKQALKALEKRHTSVRTNIATWEEVLDAIGHDGQMVSKPLVDEFRGLLSERFASIALSRDEVSMIKLKDFPVAFQSMLKLQRLVDDVQQQTKEEQTRKYKMLRIEKPKRGEYPASTPYYGFDVKAAGYKNALLWFGFENGELCVSVGPERPENYDAEVKRILRRVFNIQAKERKEDGWINFPIPYVALKKTIDDADQLLRQLLHLMDPLLTSLAASLKSSTANRN